MRDVHTRDVLDRIARRDRAVIIAALALVVGMAWWQLVSLASDMGGASMRASMAMPQAGEWSPLQPAALFVMWCVMMAAMMLPSAAPMIILFASVTRRRRECGSPAAPTVLFVAGYLMVWTAFSAIAVLGQIALHRAALLSPQMATTSRVVGGALLVAAGVYQWMPFKRRCLTHCRSPFAFFGAEWREGRIGALTMGWRHGNYCLGCCWAIMGLLFVAGVMNLLWVAVLATIVLLEKVLPRGASIGRGAGVIFGVWGIAVLAMAL